MTYETKQKADALCEKIEETKECIQRLKTRITNAELIKKGEARAYNEKRETPFMMRLLNRSANRAKEEKKKEGAEIIIFDNLGIHGADIEVDEEIVAAIVSIYERRLSEFEKEFSALE